MPFSLSSSALNDYQRYLSLLVGNAAYVDTIPLTVDYLVIAGGGGGGGGGNGSIAGGGGGAGGYRTSAGTSGGGASAETALTLEAGTDYTVTVGAGGSGGGRNTIGSSGAGSEFSTITTVAGGGGGTSNDSYQPISPTSGGSGGGGGSRNYFVDPGASGTANQGFDGGDAGEVWAAGGGGGAGSVGQDGYLEPTRRAGNGGSGVSSSITGSAVGRAGGGGGGVYVSGVAAGSASDGGAAGGKGANGSSATTNTGGGGGGAGSVANDATTVGGNGGSGLVVVKYPITYDMTVGAGLGYKTVMSGDYKITEFTSGTGTVSFALAPTVVGSGEDILQEIVLEESASSVTFSGLDAYASTYQHLQIRMTGATDRSGDWLDWLYLQFNSDTGANYAVHRMFAEGGSGVTPGAFTSQTSIVRAFYVKGALGDANSFGAGVMDILDPFETTKYTTTRAFMGYVDTGTNEQIIALISGLWQNTNAVTSIKLASLNSANLIAGSRFTLIGVK